MGGVGAAVAINQQTVRLERRHGRGRRHRGIERGSAKPRGFQIPVGPGQRDPLPRRLETGHQGLPAEYFTVQVGLLLQPVEGQAAQGIVDHRPSAPEGIVPLADEPGKLMRFAFLDPQQTGRRPVHDRHYKRETIFSLRTRRSRIRAGGMLSKKKADTASVTFVRSSSQLSASVMMFSQNH